MNAYFKVFIRAHESWCPRIYGWRLFTGVFDFVIRILTFAYTPINNGTHVSVFDVHFSGVFAVRKSASLFRNLISTLTMRVSGGNRNISRLHCDC